MITFVTLGLVSAVGGGTAAAEPPGQGAGD